MNSANPFLSYLTIADFLMNPPQGPQDRMSIGSPGGSPGAWNQPRVNQPQPWGPSAASGSARGAVAGAPFGPPGMAMGAGLGYNQGKK